MASSLPDRGLKVFLSYARGDARELAARLEGDLRRRGVEPWLDTNDLPPGVAWEDGIEAAILGAGAFVAVLTPHAVGRPDGVCLDEIAFARYQGKRIVPAMAIECRPPLGIFRLDWIDFRGWEREESYRTALERLLAAITGRGAPVGERGALLEALRPLDFGLEIARHTRDFTGRAWLREELDAWIRGSDGRALVITGDPGTGKSAIVAHLAARHPRVVAYHFCVHGLHDSLEPTVFVRSLAAQLATQIPAYGSSLAQLVLERASVSDPASLMRRLICDPLRKLELDEPLLVLVDGIDETWGAEPGIAHLLQRGIEDLPRAFRVVVTSRTVAGVLDLFGRHRLTELVATREDNLRDVEEYIHRCLAHGDLRRVMESSGVDPDQFARQLRDRSAGNFLYVTNVLRDVQTGRADPRDPGLFPAGLVALYQGRFERLFPGGTGYEEVRSLLDLVLASREPLGAAALADACGGDEPDVARSLERVEVFFPVREGRYAPYHKSIADWLGGTEGRSTLFRVNVRRGHRELGRYLLESYRRGDRGPFTLAHVAYHLAAAGDFDAVFRLLTDVGFLEDVCAGLGPRQLEEQLRAAGRGCPDGTRRAVLGQIERAIALESHWLRRDPRLLGRILHNRLLSSGEGTEGLAALVFRHGPPTPRLKAAVDLGGREERTFSGHDHGVTSCAWTPDGRRFVSGSYDETLKVWDAETGDVVATLRGHAGRVSCCAVTPDGRRVVSGSWDGTLRVWNLETGGELAILHGHGGRITRCAVDADGRRAVSSSFDRTVRVWDLEELREFGVLRGHRGPVNDCVFAPDGRTVLSASDDRTVRVWDVETRRGVAVLEGHDSPVLACAVAPEGRRALSVSRNGRLIAWDLGILQARSRLEDIDHAVTAMTVTRDGKRLILASKHGPVSLVRLDREGGTVTLTGHGWGVTGCAVTPDDRHLLTASWDQTLKLWDLEGKAEPRSRAGHVGIVWSIALTPDGRGAVSAGSDGELHRWEASTGRRHHRIAAHSSAAFACAVTPDGSRVVSGSRSGTVKVWEVATGRRIGAFGGGRGAIFDLAVLPDGRRVVAATRDPQLTVWELEGGAEVGRLVGHTDWTLACATSSDGAFLVSASRDRTLRVWDLRTMREVMRMSGHAEWVLACAFTPDGRRVLSASRDRTLRLWDVATGSEEARLEGHTDWVRGCAVTPDGRFAISASWDKTLRIWDLAAGRHRDTVPGAAPFRSVVAGHDVLCAGDEVGNVWIMDFGMP